MYWRLNMAPARENLHMAIRGGDWKLLASQDFTHFELYNLKADPQEKTDLKAAEPQPFDALRKTLMQLNAEILKEGPDWWKRLSPNGGGPLTKKAG
jgi:arylsulfatase A-like enzyme